MLLPEDGLEFCFGIVSYLAIIRQESEKGTALSNAKRTF